MSTFSDPDTISSYAEMAERNVPALANYIATSEMGDAGNGINVEAMKERLPVLSPEQDVSTLHEAGFSQVELFYAALTFRGWVAYRT